MGDIKGNDGIIASDPAIVRSGVNPAVTGDNGPPGSGEPPTVDTPDASLLEGLLERVEAVAARVETLVELLRPRIEDTGGNGDAASMKTGTRESEAAAEALIYADFFHKAVTGGMSPNMVADAYRLADLTNVTANLETKEVVGTDAAVRGLLEKKPYLFVVQQQDIGSETNPARGPSTYPEQVENLARTLGVSPEFAAALVRKRSDAVRGDAALSDLWRIPRTNRLSFLETNE